MCERRKKCEAMTQSSYADIAEQVRGKLMSQDGREKIIKRRQAAELMAKGLEELEASGWILRAMRRKVGSDRTVFTVRQSSIQKAAKGLEVSVELLGNGVGTLLPPQKTGSYPLLRTNEPEARELAWGGAEARAYVRSRSLRRASVERRVQGEVVRELLKTPKHRLLQNLWPVRPANCMMEIPTAIERRGRVGTGNIDLLARTGRGRWPTFVVCELKTDSTTTPYNALVQAIRYAAALDVEVNGISHRLPPADRSVYRRLFGSNSKAQHPLRFGAMAIVPSRRGVADDAKKALNALDTSDAWLDVMLFDGAQDGQFRPTLRLREKP